MTRRPGDGPDEEERTQPGNTGTNPAGASGDDPAEGSEEAAPRQPGSPEG